MRYDFDAHPKEERRAAASWEAYWRPRWFRASSRRDDLQKESGEGQSELDLDSPDDVA